MMALCRRPIILTSRVLPTTIYSGTLVKFGKANSTLLANLSKLIYFRVYSADPEYHQHCFATAQRRWQK